MDFPVVNDSDFQEAIGVYTVGLLLSKLGLVFRPTPNKDVGIDGQVEYISKNKAIGKIVAVQIKSGKSYLLDRGDHFAFYPKERHRNYWESFPLPVILMLHDPDNDNIYFTDARYYLSIPERDRQYNYIPVPKSSILNESDKDKLFTQLGTSEEEFLPLPDLLNFIIHTTNLNGSFPISFFDLFINGLTNLCRHSYFSMQLAEEIAEVNLSYSEDEFGLEIGAGEHDFLHSYVRFLIIQNLVKVDYSDYLIDWNERLILPQLLAPLTARGRELVTYIREIETELFSEKENEISVACERFVRMVFMLSDIYRLQKIKDFSERYNRKSI
ncbi:MAG: DUF4365 domain-containing protein [Pyrinomonadaceae bacterium]|nr:DUF4365 domain-containing protein [Pyrinomonadaceae bacterium]